MLHIGPARLADGRQVEAVRPPQGTRARPDQVRCRARISPACARIARIFELGAPRPALPVLLIRRSWSRSGKPPSSEGSRRAAPFHLRPADGWSAVRGPALRVPAAGQVSRGRLLVVALRIFRAALRFEGVQESGCPRAGLFPDSLRGGKASSGAPEIDSIGRIEFDVSLRFRGRAGTAALASGIRSSTIVDMNGFPSGFSDARKHFN